MSFSLFNRTPSQAEIQLRGYGKDQDAPRTQTGERRRTIFTVGPNDSRSYE